MKLFLSLALFAAFLLFARPPVRTDATAVARRARRAARAVPVFRDKRAAARAHRLCGRARPSCRAAARSSCTACRPRLLPQSSSADGRLPGRRSDRRRTPAARRAASDAARVNSFCTVPARASHRADRWPVLAARAPARCCTSCIILAALLAGLLTARDRGTPRAFRHFALPLGRRVSPQQLCAAVRQAAATALTVTAFLAVFSILLQLAAPVLARSCAAQHSRV